MSKAYCISSLPVFFILLIHLLVTLHRWDEINRLAVVILFASIGFQSRQVFFYQKIFLFKVWKVKLLYCFNILIQELRYGEQDMPSNPRKIGTCIMTAILIFWNWLLNFFEESTGNFKTEKYITYFEWDAFLIHLNQKLNNFIRRI